MLSPLNKGRVTCLCAVLLLCLDTPTYRLLRLSLPPSSPDFGFAVTLWRGVIGVVACSALCVLADGGAAPFAEHLRAIGWHDGILGTVLLSVCSVCFTVAVARTSAANVLVFLALGPLLTALLSRFIYGLHLPRHTWVACVAGFLCVALVFAGSFSAGPSEIGGCMLAAAVPLLFGLFLTLAASKPDVNLAPLSISGGLCSFLIAASVLSLHGSIHGAKPASARDFFMLVFNGSSNSVANLVLSIGVQSCPAAEASLINLLETALSPFLVYIAVREGALYGTFPKPS